MKGMGMGKGGGTVKSVASGKTDPGVNMTTTHAQDHASGTNGDHTKFWDEKACKADMAKTMKDTGMGKMSGM